MSQKFNYLHPSYQGIMPVRVLQHNVLHAFLNINKDFLALSKKVIAQHGVDSEIDYVAGERRAESPYVSYNKIRVFEPFLSYVWCNCYSLLVLHNEVVAKLSYNDYHGREEKEIDRTLTTDAYELWEYAVSLIRIYSPWDTDLPNPELVKPSRNELTEKTNALFEVAMAFVLAHEFAHIELGHAAPNAEFEKAADARAMDLVMQGINDSNLFTRKMGVLMGLCSLLFFKSTTTSAHYPDTDDRIEAIIARFNPDPKDAIWGVATLAYKLWDRLYNIGLTWTEGWPSFRALYYDIKRQVKERAAQNLLE